MNGFLSRRLRRFAKAESGTILPFTMVVMILLVMMGALAVNTVRFENQRASMQATLDICVLNAAALKQTLDETTVFYDCVEKNGIPSELVSDFTVREGLSSKSVTATADVEMPKFFLHRRKPEQEPWSVAGASAAEERVGNVEISLVLDVSGSMAGSRMTSLRTAAKEFVTTLVREDVDNRVSITVIPYNGQVNLGPALISRFTVTDIPSNPSNNPDVRQSRCVDLPASAYTTSAMSRTATMPATAFADTFSSTDRVNSFVSWNNTDYATINLANVWCPNSVGNQVLLPGFTAFGGQLAVDTPAERIEQLHEKIDSLTAIGATSINAGMRWGLAFLDPAARPIFDEFATEGRMPTAFRDRPHDYNNPDVMKVIVLMSDGDHFAEERVNAGFRSGLSPIWRGNDGNYSIFHSTVTSANRWWVPHNGTWRATAWRNSSNTGAAAVQLTWPQVLQTFRATYVAWQFYARALGTTSSARTTHYNNALNAIRTQTPTTTMDTQLQSVCNRARDLNVVTYTIAFEAPPNGQTQLRACASTTARYYVASTTTIRSVFASIAGNISKLRLTQ